MVGLLPLQGACAYTKKEKRIIAKIHYIRKMIMLRGPLLLLPAPYGDGRWTVVKADLEDPELRTV